MARPDGLIWQPKFWPIAGGAVGTLVLYAFSWYFFPDHARFEPFIYAYTAWVLILYTIETALMREEMVRQTELQLRPTVAGVMDGHHIKLINLGRGGAVNIEAVSVERNDGKRIKDSEINVPPDVIPPGASVEWCGCDPAQEGPFPWTVRLEYDRVDCHHRYYSLLLINPGECLLVKHDRVEVTAHLPSGSD